MAFAPHAQEPSEAYDTGHPMQRALISPSSCISRLFRHCCMSSHQAGVSTCPPVRSMPTLPLAVLGWSAGPGWRWGDWRAAIHGPRGDSIRYRRPCRFRVRTPPNRFHPIPAKRRQTIYHRNRLRASQPELPGQRCRSLSWRESRECSFPRQEKTFALESQAIPAALPLQHPQNRK